MATSLRTDIHLLPLYLKWASDFFRNENEKEGNLFFKYVCHIPREAEHKVYKQMWKIKGRPEGDPEFGRKTFHNLGGFSSSLEEKSQAIEMAIRKADRNELAMKENQIHKNLWQAHGMPLFDLEYGKHAFNNTHERSASFVEKVVAAKNYAEASRVCRFNTKNFIVDAVKRENGDLELLIMNRSSESLQSIIPDRGGRSVESMIDTVRNNFIIGTRDENTPSFHNFQRCAYFPKTVLFGNKQLNLLQTPDGCLIWHAFDPGFLKVSWILAGDEDVQIINHLMRLQESERIEYTKGLEVKSDWHEGELSSAFLSKIPQVSRIPKISFQSLMDSTKIVNRDNWAVTLINHGASSSMENLSFSPLFGHAMIVYEGIKNDTPFVKLIHLVATGREAKVSILDLEKSNPKYNSKTPTWIRSRHLVEQLEQEDGKTYLFNLTGHELLGGQVNRYTIDAFTAGCNFGRQHFDSIEDFCGKLRNRIKSYTSDLKANPDLNCLTWAKEAFEKMGIKLPDIPYLLAEPKRYVEYISSNPSLVKISN